jgi:hypothetical protein
MKRGERRRKVRNIHYSFSLSLFDFFEKKVKRLCQRQNDIFLHFCVKSGLLGKNLPLKTKKTAFDTCQRQVSFLVSFFWLKLALELDSSIVCKFLVYFLHLISYHLTKSADNWAFIHEVIRFLVPRQVWLSKNVCLFLTFYVTVIITKLQQLIRSTRKLLVLYLNWSFESKLFCVRKSQ